MQSRLGAAQRTLAFFLRVMVFAYADTFSRRVDFDQPVLVSADNRRRGTGAAPDVGHRPAVRRGAARERAPH